VRALRRAGATGWPCYISGGVICYFYIFCVLRFIYIFRFRFMDTNTYTYVCIRIHIQVYSFTSFKVLAVVYAVYIAHSYALCINGNSVALRSTATVDRDSKVIIHLG